MALVAFAVCCADKVVALIVAALISHACRARPQLPAAMIRLLLTDCHALTREVLRRGLAGVPGL